MRLLVVNPNCSEGVTARIRAAAERVAKPGDVIETVSAPSGVPLIVTEADARRAAGAVAALIAAQASRFDAAVIASFGDTGLAQARTGVSIPVLGIARSAFSAALAAGPDFSIVSFSPAMNPGFHDALRRYGVSERLRSLRNVAAEPPLDPGAVQDDLRDAMLDACREAEKDGPGSLILGGGPLAGLAHALRPSLRLPVFDGVEAAVALARLTLESRGAATAPAPA